jgi:hypothetical protein
MIITRNVPSETQIEGVTFHPGTQFISDEVYNKKLKNNPVFKAQLKTASGKKLMEITVPAEDKPAMAKQSLAETVKALSESDAIDIIRGTVDAVDLKEIVKLDKRRGVVAAAEKQIKDRQGYMDAMAPKLPRNAGEPIDLGTHE